VADIIGPEAEKFLLKVQQASAGPPWYMNSPDSVCRFVCAALFCPVFYTVI